MAGKVDETILWLYGHYNIWRNGNGVIMLGDKPITKDDISHIKLSHRAVFNKGGSSIPRIIDSDNTPDFANVITKDVVIKLTAGRTARLIYPHNITEEDIQIILKQWRVR